MVNPYFCYALSFSFSLVVYMLDWSLLYPKLTLSLLVFLIVSIGLHIVIGTWMAQNKFIQFKKLSQVNERAALYLTVFIYLLWSCEFIYEGGIPLLKIILKEPYDYKLFGIPTLHVFIVTFSSFYTIYLFHIYLSTRKNIFLFLYVLNLVAAILIYNRGMLIFNLTGSMVLFMLTKKLVSRYVLLGIPVLLIALLYCFGVLGTLREARKRGVEYDNAIFMKIGQANESFSESRIPKEFFWAYIYISSPLANLQHNINTWPESEKSIRQLAEMINNEILMDFISKRTNALFNIEPRSEKTISGPFNVSTVYSRCYSYLGWTGVIIMAVVVLAAPWIYMMMLPVDSPFFLSGFAILCTMFLFMAFDNTLRFTGLSFQLVYPLLLNLIVNRFDLPKKMFA